MSNKKFGNLMLAGLSGVVLLSSPLCAGSKSSDANTTMADSSEEAMTPEQQTFCQSLSPQARRRFKAMSNDKREMCMKMCAQGGMMNPSDCVMDMAKKGKSMDPAGCTGMPQKGSSDVSDSSDMSNSNDDDNGMD